MERERVREMISHVLRHTFFLQAAILREMSQSARDVAVSIRKKSPDDL